MSDKNITVAHPVEENNEEYQIIRENYHSSPKCGIKSLFVKKVKKNIIFSPIEISAKPYIIYCVTQNKEEQKNDISQAETNQTKINEDKNKKNIYLTNKVLKEEKSIDKDDEDRGKESEETNYIHIIEKKSSEMTINKSFNCSEDHRNTEKNNKIKNNTNILNKEKEIKLFYHKSLNEQDKSSLKMKLNLNKVDDHHKKTIKNNQINIYNILNNILIPEKIDPNKLDNKNNNKSLKTEINKDISKAKSIFNIHSIGLKKNKNENKNLSPKNIRFNPDQINNIKFSHSNNIKRLKKPKKVVEREKKVNKTNVMRQYSFIPINKIKKGKIHYEEKEDQKTRRHSLLPLNGNKKNNKKIYINILKKNKKEIKNTINKTSSLYKKMKSSGEKGNQIFKFVKYNKKFELDRCETPKRKYNCSYKLKMDDIYYDLENNNNKNQDSFNSSKKKRKVSISNSNISSKKKIKNYNIDTKEDNIRRKKSIFFNLKDKDKIIDKDKITDKSSIKEKKTKRKKKKNNKQKEDKDDKDKPDKKEKSNNHLIKKRPIRKDKSFTIKASHINKNLTNDNSENVDYSLNVSKKHSKNYEINVTNETNDKNSKNTSTKPSIQLNNNTEQNDNNRPDIRRNSTRDLFRENNRKEKIIAYTNKQTIDNINEYTRQCLQIIPELYELKDKMPRCKTKINPNFSKNKKIALFDLDETIVHCIGEINMNNLESLSRQSDAKIKVHLPGGKREVTVGINIRPNWEEALRRIKDKYHIIAFTASHESYADSVLNYLDSEKKYFEYRLYRCHCVLCVMNGAKFYVKDLKILEDNYDLKDVVIIDNSVLSFAYHLDNGIPISPFYDTKNDTELLDIADFLLEYADENDIRNKLKEVYKLNEYLEILKDYTSEENEEISDSSGNEKDKNTEKNNTNKNTSFNKNEKNININNLNNSNNSNTNESKDNNDMHLSKAKKNISQINLKLKEISNLFDKEENKEPKNNKHPTQKVTDQKKNKSNEKKYSKRKSKRNHKTILLDINFKKEWEEKQKELKNKK